MAEVGKWMEKNGDAIYGTRGAGIVRNADGSEVAKTTKDGKTFTITIRSGKFPEVAR